MTSAYPQADEQGSVRDIKGNVKCIYKVQTFGCPRVDDEKNTCKHNVYIYYTDGTHTMYWQGGPEVEAKELLDLGYGPWLTIYKNDHPLLDKLQQERCNLIKTIPLIRQVDFKSCWSGRSVLRAPINGNTIYYQLQSSTGVPQVFCTECGLGQNFAYTSVGENVAWWSTKKKDGVLCATCIKFKNVPVTDFVPIHRKGDLPAYRSQPMDEETGLWDNHENNLRIKPYLFDFSCSAAPISMLPGAQVVGLIANFKLNNC